MKKKKIIILGGTGFIGKNLVNYFLKEKKYIVSATFNKTPFFKNEKVKWVKLDLRDSKKITNLFRDVDIVIQAAATTSGAKDIIEKPYIHVTDNAVMNSLILRQVFHSNVKHFIFFSCTVMYPNSNKKIKESQKIEKIYPKYFGVANTKLYVEKMCKFYSNISPTKFTIIRHSNIYGPFDKFDLDRSHMLGATITKVGNTLKKNKENKINVWGDGLEKRDLLYIDDLVDFVVLVLKKQTTNFEIFNCGYGKAFSVIEIVEKIIKNMNSSCKIEFDKTKPSLKTSLFLDYGKAFKIIGWKPKTDLDSGIKKTVKWWKNNIKN